MAHEPVHTHCQEEGLPLRVSRADCVQALDVIRISGPPTPAALAGWPDSPHGHREARERPLYSGFERESSASDIEMPDRTCQESSLSTMVAAHTSEATCRATEDHLAAEMPRKEATCLAKAPHGASHGNVKQQAKKSAKTYSGARPCESHTEGTMHSICIHTVR